MSAISTLWNHARVSEKGTFLWTTLLQATKIFKNVSVGLSPGQAKPPNPNCCWENWDLSKGHLDPAPGTKRCPWLDYTGVFQFVLNGPGMDGVHPWDKRAVRGTEKPLMWFVLLFFSATSLHEFNSVQHMGISKPFLGGTRPSLARRIPVASVNSAVSMLSVDPALNPLLEKCPKI